MESKPPFFPSSAGSGGGGGFHLADTSLCITYSKCRSIIVKTNDPMTAHDSSAMVLAFSVAVPTSHTRSKDVPSKSPLAASPMSAAPTTAASTAASAVDSAATSPADPTTPSTHRDAFAAADPGSGSGGISSCGSEGQITVNAPTDRPNAAASIPPSPNAARSRVSL